MMPSTNEQHSRSWLPVVKVVLYISCFLYAVADSTGPEDILFCRLIVHIASDLTSYCWNQLHYLTQIIMSARYSFSAKITDCLSICGKSENRGVLMNFKAEHIDSFPGKEKVRR